MKLFSLLACIALVITMTVGCSAIGGDTAGTATEAGNPELATVSGVILDSNGVPAAFLPFEMHQNAILESAQALLLKVAAVEGITSINDTTDENGRYEIHNIIPGDYVIVTKPPVGEYPVRVNFNVAKNDTLAIESVQSVSLGVFQVQFQASDDDPKEITLKFSGIDSLYTYQHSGYASSMYLPIPAGTYLVEIVLPNRTVSRELVIGSGLQTEWEVPFDEPVGTAPGNFEIQFMSTSVNAQELEITFSGSTEVFTHTTALGQTSFFRALDPGIYTVTIKMPDESLDVRTLVIDSGLETEWEVRVD